MERNYGIKPKRAHFRERDANNRSRRSLTHKNLDFYLPYTWIWVDLANWVDLVAGGGGSWGSGAPLSYRAPKTS